MKKFLAISIGILYLAVSSGLLLEVHHCMGRIADAGFTFITSNQQDACGNCGMDVTDGKNHCCKDEYKLLKISADQKASSLQFTVDAPVVSFTPLLVPEEYIPIPRETASKPYIANPPPEALAASVQSLLCVFRI